MELAISHDAAKFIAKLCDVEDLQPGLLGPATGSAFAEFELPESILDESGAVTADVAAAIRTVANPKLLIYVLDSSVGGSGAIDHFASDGLSCTPVAVAEGMTRIGSPLATSELANVIAKDCTAGAEHLSDAGRALDIPADLAFLCEAWARAGSPGTTAQSIDCEALVASIERLSTRFQSATGDKADGTGLLRIASANDWIYESSGEVSLSKEAFELCEPILAGEGMTVARIDAPAVPYGIAVDDSHIAELIAGGEALRFLGERGQRWLVCPGSEPLSLRLVQLPTELVSELLLIVLHERESPSTVPVALDDETSRERDPGSVAYLESGSEALLTGAQLTFARLEHEAGQRSIMTNLLFAPDATATFEVVDESGIMTSASINCFRGASVWWQQSRSGIAVRFQDVGGLDSLVEMLFGSILPNESPTSEREDAFISIDPAEFERPVSHWSNAGEFRTVPDDGFKKFRLEILRTSENGEIVGEETVGFVATGRGTVWTIEFADGSSGMRAQRSDRAKLATRLKAVLDPREMVVE